MSPGQRIDGPIKEQIERLAIAKPGWTPSQIQREIGQHGKRGPWKVSLSTVRRVMGAMPPPDESDPWSIADGDAEDIPLVLPVAVMLGREVGWPSRGVGAWIARIRRAYPDLEDLSIVAYLALYANRGGPHLKRVQDVMAYTVWRDLGALLDAVDAGEISRSRAYLAASFLNAESAFAQAELDRRMDK